MKYFIIFNPGSNGGKSRKRLKKLKALLSEYRINYDLKWTESLYDAYDLSKKANLNGYDAVIAVGGDGTINQVLNGFYDNEGKLISKAFFGVIYTGTSPDFCKSYNIPLNLSAALKVIKNNQTRKIKIGKIILSNENLEKLDHQPVDFSSSFITRYFSCCVNIGLGSDLARRANAGIRKIVGDSLGTFLSLIQTLLFYKAGEVHLKLDGMPVTISRLFNLSVGKTYYVASGIKIRNAIEFENKNFYALMINKLNFLRFLRVIFILYSGRKIVNHSYFQLKYCNQIEILGNFMNPEIEFDGDPVGFLPCIIEEAKEPLNLICRVETT